MYLPRLQVSPFHDLGWYVLDLQPLPVIDRQKLQIVVEAMVSAPQPLPISAGSRHRESLLPKTDAEHSMRDLVYRKGLVPVTTLFLRGGGAG